MMRYCLWATVYLDYCKPRLFTAEFYRQNGNRIPEIKARISEIEKETGEAYERWEVLEAIAKLL